MALIRSIGKVSSLTLSSRILGFVRDILMALFLGAGFVADCFFIAFKLPNFFRRLFAEGAFNAAFVPLFCEALGPDRTQDDRTRARWFAEEVLAVFLPVLLLFTAGMQIFMPWVMVVMAPGFLDDPAKFDLAVSFTRLTFPYLMLISLVALFSGALNGMNRFAVAAAAPILLNFTLIGALLLFNDTQLEAGKSLSIAVTVAGLVQFFWLLQAAAREGLVVRLRLPRITPRVRELGRIILPAALGAGAVQINLLIDIILASTLPEGSLSWLFYADRLNQLPLGVIGVAVGTVLLPALSRALSGAEGEAAHSLQSRAIEAALLITLPAAAALIAIPGPLIGTLFERGAFTPEDTAATALALMAYAAGLPAYVLIKVLTPAFYARKDTATPVKVATAALGINLVFNLLLMGPLLHAGLALATAIAAWANAGTLYILLHRRGIYTMPPALGKRLFLLLLSSAAMAGLVFWAAQGVAPWFSGGELQAAGALGLLVLLGVAGYFVLVRLLAGIGLAELKAMLKG